MLLRPDVSLRAFPVANTIISTGALITFLTSIFLRFPNMHSSSVAAGKVYISAYSTCLCYRFDVSFLESAGIICLCNFVYQQTAYGCFPLFPKSNLSEHSIILILHNLVNNSTTTALCTALVILLVTSNPHHLFQTTFKKSASPLLSVAPLMSNQNCGQYPTHRWVLCFIPWYLLFILPTFPNNGQRCIRICWQLPLTSSFSKPPVTGHVFTQQQLYGITTESGSESLLSHTQHTQHKL